MDRRFRSALEDSERLSGLHASGLLDTPPEPDFDRWTSFVRTVLEADVSLITLLDRDRQFFKSTAGLGEPWSSSRQTPLSHSFCKHVVGEGAALVVSDARQDPELRDNRAIDELGVIAYAGVPLRTGQGHLIGSLSAISRAPREWTDRDVAVLRDAAAAVTAEVELRTLENRSRAIIAASADAIWVFGEEGIPYDWTPVARPPGRDAGEGVAESVLDLVHPNDRQALLQARDRVMESPDAAASVTVRISPRDGETRVLEIRLTNLLDDPAVPGILGVGRDVTARKRAEERLSLLVSHAPVALWTVDRDLRFVWVDGRGMRELGIEKDEIVGTTVQELFGTEDEDSPPLVAYRRALDGELVEFDVEWGGVVWEVHLNPLVEEERVTGVVGAALNVTEHRETGRRLEERTAYFQRLFNEAPEAIVLLDKEDRIIQVNPEFERLFGYTPEEAVGQPINDLVSIPGRESEAKELTERVAEGERIEVEATRRHKDGTPIEVSILATPVHVKGERRVYGIYRDITEQKSLEAQLLHSQRLDAVGQLAGGVAHDFNNILTAILGHTRILLDELDHANDDRFRKDLEQIQTSGQRAARLTRQLLTFSRRDVVSAHPLDINEVIRNTRNLLDRLIEERVQLHFDLRDAIPMVEADPGQIEQILMNLVINARDAMGAGGRVTVSTGWTTDLPEGDASEEHGGWVVLEVSDEGCGMSVDEQARMFEPFFTTKKPGEGTGLGLSTVYGIIERMGGFIEVDTERGRGTTLKIFMPPSSPQEVERTERPERERAPGGASGTGELVLLVDDDRPVRKVTRRILERAGYRVVEAESGDAALALCERKEIAPDVVLTDIVMPGMSGYDLIERLRRHDPDIGVLLMTGYTEGPPGAEPENILTKPFDTMTLIRRVNEKIAERRAHPSG